MGQLPDNRRNIYTEETQFRGAVSEDLAQKFGSSINFINNQQYAEKNAQINGDYYLATLPYYAVDGMVFFNQNSEVVNVFAEVRVAGSSGTTQFDVEYSPSPGSSWTSIFSTKPAFSYTAGNYVWVDSAGLVTLPSGVTRPVLSTTTFAKGGALRINLLTAQTASASGCGLTVMYRPIN